MNYTFVPQFDGESPKRRRLAKACESCRARKKRCLHNSLDDGEDTGHSDEEMSDKREVYKGISVRKGRSNRFLSDLNPQTRLLERNMVEGEPRSAKSMAAVGMWVNKNEYELLLKHRAANSNNEQLQDDAAILRPHRDQLTALIDIYFLRIHPFLPLLDEADFRQAYAAGALPEPYIHAVCLLAAKDNSAEAILNTTTYGPAMSPRQLCRSLYLSTKAAIAAPSSYDRITLIRILALLSMHTEGPEGPDEAAMHLVQGMHYCQTLGLHLSSSFPDKDGKITKRLFWCLWILDRLTAMMGGRPILMADIDVAIEPFESGESGFPAFDILFKIVMAMNEIIDFYRPGKDHTVTGWETSFPGFDEIVESTRGWSLSPSVLSTLHIAYLAGAILSHRSKGNARYASQMPSYVRQQLATSKIIRSMSLPRLHTLHPLPILPYAVSLALSVSYQHMRQDQLQTQQEDAKSDFESCMVILEDLRGTWSSVDAMCTLAHKVSAELNRVPDMASFRVRRDDAAERQIEDFSSGCKMDGKRQDFAPALEHTNGSTEAHDQATWTSTGLSQTKDHRLFDGIDDIFGTYLDPNYPVNLDFINEIEDILPPTGGALENYLQSG